MKQRKTGGFTLVEVIVVLVLLAILAAIGIPALTGYIEEAKRKVVVADARNVLVAAKAAVVEQYALNPDYDTIARKFQDSGKPRGRVTSNMLYQIQNNKPSNNQNDVDAAIAKQVLRYLDSSNKSTAVYKFPSSNNGMNWLVKEYQTTHKQPIVIISYTPAGQVDFIEFGYDGYLVHIKGADSTATVTKNGRSSAVPD